MNPERGPEEKPFDPNKTADYEPLPLSPEEVLRKARGKIKNLKKIQEDLEKDVLKNYGDRNYKKADETEKEIAGIDIEITKTEEEAKKEIVDNAKEKQP